MNTDAKEATVGRVVDVEARLAATVDDLRAAGVRYVSGSIVDTGSINRLKSVPLGKLASLATKGLGFSYCWATALTNDHFTETDVLGGPSGDMRMIADLDSLVQLGATPEWAWVALDQYLQDGGVAPWCERSFAKRLVGQAAERGYSLRMTYEFEWFVGKVVGDGMLGACHLGPG